MAEGAKGYAKASTLPRELLKEMRKRGYFCGRCMFCVGGGSKLIKARDYDDALKKEGGSDNREMRGPQEDLMIHKWHCQ